MKNYSKKGFTLIELLIVIAVLGTLAVVVLIAINPIQQLARARDAGRSSAVAQLGHGYEARATVNNGIYVAHTAGCAAAAGGWITNCLVSAGEIQTTPVNQAYSTLTPAPTCAAGIAAEGGWCLNSTTAAFVVYARAEAVSNDARCAAPATEDPYFVYSSTAGRGGLWCGAAAPVAGAANVAGNSASWRN